MIDANLYVGESLYRNSLSAADALNMMRENGVERAVIRPMKPCDYNYDKANREIAELQKAHPEWIAFGRVNPLERTAPQQIERAIREYGLKGIHLHPWEDNFQINDPKIYDSFDAIQALGVPVYVSTGYPCVSEPLQLLEVMKRYPKITAIATHAAQLDMSGISFDDSLLTARECGNIYYDLSGVYRRDFIEKLIAAAGEHRVVFGSNAPYMSMWMEIDRIRFTQIPAAQKEKIFDGNIKKILHLD